MIFIIFTIKIFTFEKRVHEGISQRQVTEQTGPETWHQLDPSRMSA